MGARPGLASVNVDHMLFPDTYTTVLVAAGNDVAPWRTSARELTGSPRLWQRMHLRQWNLVPDPLRTQALDRMLTRYRDVLFTPRRWDSMSIADWDAIPQPMRVLAYRHMAAYWTGFYQLGAGYGHSSRHIADILAAIIMSESWFDHRAYFVNRYGL
jgi:hypothetical protein